MSVDLLLVGCGKMGSALLSGWLDAGTDPSTVAVIERAEQHQAIRDTFGVSVVASLDALGEIRPSVVMLAVKPQILTDAAPAYAALAHDDTMFLSIAAGKTLAFFTEHLGAEARIVRAMPNTPAAVGRGATALVATDTVTAAQRDHATRLMAAVGTALWLDNEGQMDAVTALSGSGPAYVFHMVEAMTSAGVQAGLSAALAGQLARATVAGAGALLDASDEEAAQLRKNVTSPGGTTAAGLTILMEEADGLTDLMTRTVEAAKRRSIELA